MINSEGDTQKIETLIELNTLINSSYDSAEELLEKIVESSMTLTGGEAASLLLLNLEDKKLYFEIALGSKGKDVQKFSLNIGEGIAGWVAKHNRALIVNDVDEDARFFAKISQDIGFKTNSIIAVPMRLKDTCIGVIELINKINKTNFTEDDRRWLEIFANQAALAITNAESFRKVSGEMFQLKDQLNNERGYHTFISEDKEIKRILQVVDRVAPTDTSVLILGESGVGKELIAEQLHLRSNRQKSPFIRVNCASLPENLLESELFGHVKGAFTDANQDRIGKFEAAADGTIFLDEIGEISLSVQAKLLRVLEAKIFEPLGSNDVKKVRSRILAATNKNLEELVEEGTFREDLYYRLNVIPINIPPLRARPDDIPVLADFFLKKYTQEMNKSLRSFSSEIIDLLLSYRWPGNVRELQNVIERAVVISSGNQILAKHLLLFKDETGNEDMYRGKNLKDAINQFKKHFVTRCLESNKWNQTITSAQLGIQRTYLSRLLKELSIERQSVYNSK